MLWSRAGVAPVVGALLGVLVGAMVLAGCQSNPEPPPLETESPSSSPSQAPTEAAAPTMPPEAEGITEAAAKAFVRHYVELINHTTRTGDTTALSEVSAKRCGSCEAIVERINGVYEAGGSIESDGWKVQSVECVPLQPARRPIVDVGLVFSKQVVRRTENSEPETFDGGRLPATFRLARRPTGWVVLDWERVQ